MIVSHHSKLIFDINLEIQHLCRFDFFGLAYAGVHDTTNKFESDWRSFKIDDIYLHPSNCFFWGSILFFSNKTFNLNRESGSIISSAL